MVRTVKKVDRIYLAGLTDGEGSLQLIHQKWTTKRGLIYTHVPVVSITNLDGEMIRRVRIAVGYGQVQYKPSTRIWVFSVRNKSAIAFLKAIKCYFWSKGDQAELLLNFHRRFKERKAHDQYRDQTSARDFCNRLRELHYRFTPGAKRLVRCSVPYIPPKHTFRTLARHLALEIGQHDHPPLNSRTRVWPRPVQSLRLGVNNESSTTTRWG